MREDQRHHGSKQQKSTIKQKWVSGETTQTAPGQISINLALNLLHLPGHNTLRSSLNTKWQSVLKGKAKHNLRRQSTIWGNKASIRTAFIYDENAEPQQVPVTAGRNTEWYTLEDSWHKLNIIFPYEPIILLLGIYQV